jgi:hypothetical protein
MSDQAPKKEKKKPRDGEAAEGAVVVSISAHPRARVGVRRARTRAAFLAFALVLVLNLLGDQTLFDAAWRALLAGLVVNIVVWRCAIVVWRHIILSELRQVAEARAARRRAEFERLQAQAAAEQANASPYRAA